MKKNKTIPLDKFQTIKKWEEMNHVSVGLVKNSSTAMVLYKAKKIKESMKAKLIHQLLRIKLFSTSKFYQNYFS